MYSKIFNLFQLDSYFQSPVDEPLTVPTKRLLYRFERGAIAAGATDATSIYRLLEKAQK
ncbi:MULTISPECIES: hypothetical protein [unclassified Scytonema]|uniref:hypothetical protein n=1 Tax=unclassified Scytonema TaxID=2618749 RepID=UPI000B31DBE5|nr:hypothetical protein [Scytonema sp. HK-05]